MSARPPVSGNPTPTPRKKLRLEALDEIALVVGDASLVLKKNGTIVIKGANIELSGSGKVTVKASGDLSLKGSKILNN
jgi:type VI secretion system secreted protein VgrG